MKYVHNRPNPCCSSSIPLNRIWVAFAGH